MQVLLGEIITWDIPGTEVELSVMRQAFIDAGLGDPDEFMKDMRVASAFSRATKELKKDRLVQKVKSDRGNTTYQLTQNALNGDRINHVYEAILGLDSQSGVVTSADNATLASETSKKVQYHLEHRNAGDINRLIQNLFKDRADLFPINPKKGTAYFVAETHRSFTDSVQKFVRDMGGSLNRWPVPTGTSDGNESVAAAITCGMDRMVGELEEVMSEWDDSTRKDTLERSQEKWDLITVKLSAYSDFLADSKTDLEKKVAEAKKRIALRLTCMENPASLMGAPGTGKSIDAPQELADAAS